MATSRGQVRPGGKKRSTVALPPGELGLIEHIRSRVGKLGTRRGELQLGIGDDCAILRPRSGEDLVVTTDLSLEGRHFRRDWHSPESIGHRTLARGLSDLAAMGARPVAAFLSLALPLSVAREPAWVEGFLDGLLALAERTRTPLAGGDTSQAPGDEVIADIVLLGAVARGAALRRDGARPGDGLYVTGALGGAAAQLQTLMDGKKELGAGTADWTQPHFFPEPRLRAGLQLTTQQLATAAIDLSDGLSTDLQHLCKASQVIAEVNEDKLPLHALLEDQSADQALTMALHGGEDYELLFTARPNTRVPRRLGGVRVTQIGRIAERGRGRPTVTLVRASGARQALARGGWEHLR